MAAMRYPKLAEMKQDPFIGVVAANMLEAIGVDDSDLPDIIADDFNYDDPDALVRAFPNVFAKLAGLDGTP